MKVRIPVAAAVAAVLLLSAAPAQARPAPKDTVIPSRACQAAGTTQADQAIADRLSPLMTGHRLGPAIGGRHISCARSIVSTVRDRGLDPRAAVLAVTTAITESSLHNYTRAVDHDSLGLFQQRPSQGWGRPDQLTDAGFATEAFLNALVRKFPGGRWMSGDVGQICQAVQRSAFPLAYTPEARDAQLIVNAVWSLPAGATSAKAPAKKGPFQRRFASATTALAVAGPQQAFTMADWNADRRADLVVIRRSGTASGRTEVYVLDGASGFRGVLLQTGTVLGPTDDRHRFSLADWNGDGRLDLVVVQTSGTPSGRTEVRVLDGASFFQRDLAQVATALGPVDDRHEVLVADWNADARPDLVVVQKAGTASGRTEVRVLDAATNFQSYLEEAVTAAGPLDDRHDVTTADWNADGRPDLVVVDRSSGKRVTVQVLDGVSRFARSVLNAETVQPPVDERYRTFVTDWNADGRPDLVVLQTTETPSGRGEARILSGR